MPVAGLYISAVPTSSSLLVSPPVISTLPFINRVAVCQQRVVVSDAVTVQEPVVGSYNSWLDRIELVVLPANPPVIRTFPPGNSVAVCPVRGTDIGVVGDQTWALTIDQANMVRNISLRTCLECFTGDSRKVRVSCLGFVLT